MSNTQQAVADNSILAQETAVTTREQENASDEMVDAINEIAVVAEQNAVSSDQIASTITDQVESLELFPKFNCQKTDNVEKPGA